MLIILIFMSLNIPVTFTCDPYWTLCNDGWINPAPKVFQKCIDGRPVTIDYNIPKTGWTLVCED